MIVCDDLVAFADGELEPVRAHAFRLHLMDCDACRVGLIQAMQLGARLNPGPLYHLRVAREARLVESNVLWFDWCGYVYAEPSGTYDLSIFLRNCAIGGALCEAISLPPWGWYPGCQRPWRAP